MNKSNRRRIGLISDLHGNLVATQSALAALDKLGVDQLLCLGDVAVSGPQPHETLAVLRELQCPVVMGNTDAWALDPQPFAFRNADTPIVFAIEEWGAQQLDTDDRDFIQSFAPTIQLELDTTVVLCYHGSPRSNLEDIHATSTEAELDEIFADHTVVDDRRVAVAIGGHTHTQMVRRHRELLIVNPGSVGMPVSLAHGATKRHYPPWTEFGILEINNTAYGPSLHIELHRIPIDVDAVIDAAKQSSMPHVEWHIDHWQRGITTT